MSPREYKCGDELAQSVTSSGVAETKLPTIVSQAMTIPPSALLTTAIPPRDLQTTQDRMSMAAGAHCSGCECDNCSGQYLGFYTCTCGQCDPFRHHMHYATRLGRHNALCQCEDELNCSTYQHSPVTYHWINCQCPYCRDEVDEPSPDGCCCPLCSRMAYVDLRYRRHEEAFQRTLME